MAKMSRSKQNKVLTKKGYNPPEDYMSDESLYGNSWDSQYDKSFMAIKWKGDQFLRFEYRLLDLVDCYKGLYADRTKFGFKPHSITEDEYETYYHNFVNNKYALIFVWWDSEGAEGGKYYQVRIETLEYFNNVDLESQKDGAKSFEEL